MTENLIFLPGMMCDERLFEPQIKHLSNSFDIVTADLTTQTTIAGIAKSVLDTVKFDNFSLCGLSMGGIVAFELMKQAPERIHKVALLNTTHWADAPKNKPIREKQIELVNAGKLRDVIIEQMKPNYLAKQNRDDTNLLNLLVEMAIDLGDEAFINQSLALMSRQDYTSILQDWAKPCLVLCGEEDELCPPERHMEMHGLIGNAVLEIISGAGHISTLEQTDEINLLLTNFFI
ncbi:MAG: alpha/beta fold hydrolase [Alphaproteobacteria bacterium]